MFGDKIFDIVKSYISDYLFGFDKTQLDTSILKGKVKIKKVNIKPEKINEMIDQSMLPFRIKAGIIGYLELKIANLSMSMWSIPMTLNIDTLLLIVGPTTSHMSHDDSFMADENEDYDDGNAYDFRNNNVKMTPNDITQNDFQNAQKKKIEEVSQIADSIREIMKKLKNLKVHIKKVHVRYEDDYFEVENPYSFGIIADEVIFDSNEAHSRGQNLPGSEVVDKQLDAFNTRMYWNSMSETFIPTSLWEQTKDLEYRIFEAISADDLFDLMYEPFQTRVGKQYFSNKDELILPMNLRLHLKFSCMSEQPENMKFSLSLKADSLSIEINDNVIADMRNLVDFYNNYLLCQFVKQYRPRTKPITHELFGNSSREDNKRKMVSRDWWQLIIWANRMQKLREIHKHARYSDFLASKCFLIIFSHEEESIIGLS